MAIMQIHKSFKMKIILLSSTLFFISLSPSFAQQFINKARIEYEVKSNVKKTIGTGMWAEMLTNNMPEFMTVYYTNTFANNTSIYKFDRWGDSKVPSFLKSGQDENVWFFNFNSDKFGMQKNISGSNINVSDSIPHFKWKLENENRMIAGFNCRKAVAVLFDSVYVFAFYTEEITISGGPQSINGLPGMILGVTIPRLYTSWIATKVMLNGVEGNEIKPLTAKKQYGFTDLKALMNERTKDWYSNDDSEDKDVKERIDRLLWSIYL